VSVSLRADFTLIDGRLEPNQVVHVGRDGLIEAIESRGRGQRAATPTLTVSGDAGSTPGDFSTASGRGVHRLRNKALLPGFCNAHSHAFQRLLRGRTERRLIGRSGDDFWSWRSAMYRITQNLQPEDVEVVSRMAFMEMLRAGYTHVSEFHYLHNQVGGQAFDDPTELSARVLAAADTAGIGITLLRVAYQRGGAGVAASSEQRRFTELKPERYLAAVQATERWTEPDAQRPVLVGMAAHSVRALDESYLRAIAEMASEGGYRLHAHVAEQPREIEECLEEHGKRPMEVLADCGLLGEHFTAVHATHLEAHEAQLLGDSGSGVCVCPTTERNLGDGLANLQDLLESEVPLAIGSDSQARIDPLAELRSLEDGERLRRGSRNCLVQADGAVAPNLLVMGTAGGRRASGLPAGGIEVGQRADLVAVDISAPSLAGVQGGANSEEALLAAMVFAGSSALVRDVWVGGRNVVEDGTMLRWDSTLEEYRRVVQKIWS